MKKLVHHLFGVMITAVPIISGAFEPRPYAVPPQLNNDVRVLMIDESNDMNQPCPCPYSPDAIGGQCGTESKYYRPGGYRVLCYMKDIRPEEVYYYRIRRGTPYAAEHW